MQKTRRSATAATPASAIIYARVSTAHQRDAKTITEQLDTCGRLVEHHGLRLMKYGPKRDGIILDDGVSGSLLEGRAFAKLVDDLQAGRVKVDRLVVYSLSRIARLDKSSRDMDRLVQSATDNARIKAVLLGAGVKVIDEDGENDPATVMFDLKLTLAAEEYKLIRQRTMGGRRRRLAEGKYARGGRPPFGYRAVYANGTDNKDGWRVEPHPEEARHVRSILGWYAAGGLSHAARKADGAKIPPPRGARWTKSAVLHMVARVAVYYSGEQTIMQGGTPYLVKFPPIIDGDLHAAVERRRKESARREKTKFLSAGFCTCTKCKGRVWVKNGIGRIDAPSYRYIRCDCGSMSAPRFQSALWVMVATRYLQIAAHEKSNGDKGAAAYDAELRDARAKVKAIQDKLDTLARGLANGMDEDTWRNANAPLVDEKTAAQREVARIERERDEAAQQKATVETTEARVGKVLERLRIDGAPDVDGCRKLLADVLVGGRVTVTWPERAGYGCAPWAAITLPAFGKLEAFTGRTDQIPERVLGAAVRKGGAVEVMVQSAPRDLGAGATLSAYTTAPLAHVLEGKGGRVGVRLYVPPREGTPANRALLLEGGGALPSGAVLEAPAKRAKRARARVAK